MSKGLTEDDISMKGIGYKEIIGYFHGNYDKDEAIDLIKKIPVILPSGRSHGSKDIKRQNGST